VTPDAGQPSRASAPDDTGVAARGQPHAARKLIAIASIAVALVVLGVLAVRKQLRDGNDFPIYWQAARDLLAGHALYDVGTGLHGYVYLPWFAMLLAPLAHLPLPAAAAVWYVANVLFLWFGARAVLDAIRLAGLMPANRTLFFATLPLAGLAHDNLVLGQANLCLFWLVASATRAAVASSSAGARPARSAAGGWPGALREGAAAGLAAALKMPAGLLVVPLAIRRRWRPAAMFVASVALVLTLPLLVRGPGGGVALYRDWASKVLAPAAAGTLQGSKVIDQSPHAGLRRLLVDEPAFGETRVNVLSLEPRTFARVSRRVAAALLAAYVLVWLAAPARATPRALLLDLSLGCCAMVQVTGFNLKAQFVVLLLPAWTAATMAFGRGTRAGHGSGSRVERVLLIAAGALFLLSQPDLVGRAASNLLLAYSSMAVGTLLLAAALARLRWAASGGRSGPDAA